MPAWCQDRVAGFVWQHPTGTCAALPPSWDVFFANQTLPEVPEGGKRTYRLLLAGLPDSVPHHLGATLLEEMAWALVSRLACDAVLHPFFVTLARGRPPTFQPCGQQGVDEILRSGFIAMCRPEAAGKLARWAAAARGTGRATQPPDLAMEVASRALLEERSALTAARDAPLPDRQAFGFGRVKARLTPRQRKVLKAVYVRVRGLLEPASRHGGHHQDPTRETPLALGKAWTPPFPHPSVEVRVRPVGARLPVWLALHWLELGGAEKFAVDLIKALPKDRYAVYVTTDVPSEDPWAGAIRNQVEELLHLPAFLPDEMVGAFCAHYVRTRRLRLLHVNHAPRVYESLPHIRRFHPALKVLHTLHILELPPNDGGYPEWAMARWGPFIDHHHVISEQLKQFLMERWLVPEDRIDVVRINVDPRWFDPAVVPRGSVRHALGVPETAILIGFVGRLTRQKRPLEFVRLAKILSDQWVLESREPALHFLMVGDGNLRDEVQAAIRAAGLEEVVHLLDETMDTRPAYVDSDLIAMPSENEGLALVTYEAMAMATPVFFTDVGAQSELLEPGQLAEREMPVAPSLADRIWPYLIDPEKRRALGERERARILRDHSMADSLERLRDLYARLLEDRDAGRPAPRRDGSGNPEPIPSSASTGSASTRAQR